MTWRRRLECHRPGNTKDCRGRQKERRRGRIPPEPPEMDTLILGLCLHREWVNVCGFEPPALVLRYGGPRTLPSPAAHTLCLRPTPPASAPPALPPSQACSVRCTAQQPLTSLAHQCPGGTLLAMRCCLYLRESLLAAVPGAEPSLPHGGLPQSSIREGTLRGSRGVRLVGGFLHSALRVSLQVQCRPHTSGGTGTGGICCLKPSEPRTIQRLLCYILTFPCIVILHGDILEFL